MNGNPVYVHRNITSVGYGDHTHVAPPADPDAPPTRCWSFECTPQCEERILRTVEFSGRTDASVPLTVEERAAEETFTASAKADVTNLAAALAQLGKAAAQAPAA